MSDEGGTTSWGTLRLALVMPIALSGQLLRRKMALYPQSIPDALRTCLQMSSVILK
jgi:hypothetical protein